MMAPAQWHSEFVADLASQRSRLGKFEVVGIARTALADKTGLGCDERQMGFVSFAHGLDQREAHFSSFRRQLMINRRLTAGDRARSCILGRGNFCL